MIFQLLRASMDYGRALLFLLGAHPADLATVALGMHAPKWNSSCGRCLSSCSPTKSSLRIFFRKIAGPERRTR